jgi:hypothetical protein
MTTDTTACQHSWCVAPHDADGSARRSVALARQRLDAARRGFMRRQAGAADVHAAEAALDQALDRLTATSEHRSW